MASNTEKSDKDQGRKRHAPLFILSLAAAMVMLFLIAFALVLAAAVFIWSKRLPQGFAFRREDWGLLALMATLASMCGVLGLKIRRELNGRSQRRKA